MTEVEALEIIIEQFAGEAGIVPRLRAGLGLNEEANTHVFAALDVLREAWRDRLRIPKRAVRAFVFVDDTIGEMSNQHGDLGIAELQMDLTIRIEECLRTDQIIQDEYERALASLVPGSPSQRIHDAWGDERGLLMALHDGKGLDPLEGADLFDAVSAFGSAFRDVDDIPRTTAYPLATLSGYVAGRWGIYRHRPAIQEQILALAEDLRNHIIESLGDCGPSDIHQMKMDLSE
jgi:hypothetical protein